MSGNTSCPICHKSSTLLFTKEHGNTVYHIYKCPGCGMGFVHPMPTNEELARFYQGSYYQGCNDLGYNAPYESLETGLKKTYRKIIRRIQRLSMRKAFPAVLDVGCAYGYFLDCASDLMGSTIRVGLDLSDAAQEAVKRKGYHFVKGRFEEATLPYSDFDLVFMGDVFEHFAQPVKVMERLDDLVRPGGVVAITTVDFSSWAARLLKKKWRLMTPPEHLLFWTPVALKKLFVSMGWYGIVSGYTLYYPKHYVKKVFEKQFGLYPFFLDPVPLDTLPIPSYDVTLAIFWKRA